MMTRSRLGITAGAFALVLVYGMGATATRAQQPSDTPRTGTAEQIGESIDDAIQVIRRNFKHLSSEAQDRLAQARASVSAMNVEARVYARLHWDKHLANADLAIEVDRDGRATLTGYVPDAAAKAAATKLALETVGVNAVTDQLIVGINPATTTTTTTPASTPSRVPAP